MLLVIFLKGKHDFIDGQFKKCPLTFLIKIRSYSLYFLPTIENYIPLGSPTSESMGVPNIECHSVHCFSHAIVEP